MQNFNDLTKRNFFNYLSSLDISAKTYKNYRSDISHFESWIKTKIKSFGSLCESLDSAIPFLTTSSASEYKSELINAKVSPKTINRRLSTLRHLSRFLTASQIVDFDFMGNIENVGAKKTSISVDSAIEEFRAYLEAEKASPNTIKNYLSDIKQFLTWLEKNQQSILNN